MLPRHLRNFTAFVDGVGQAGSIESLTLPTLALTTDTHRAGGMDGVVEIDLGMELLELSATFASYDAILFSQFGGLDAGRTVVIRGSIQRQGEAAQPVVIRMVGSVKNLDRGEWAAGSKASNTATWTLQRYQETINGVEVAYIDVVGMIRRINGVDQLASQRAALGI